MGHWTWDFVDQCVQDVVEKSFLLKKESEAINKLVAGKNSIATTPKKLNGCQANFASCHCYNDSRSVKIGSAPKSSIKPFHQQRLDVQSTLIIKAFVIEIMGKTTVKIQNDANRTKLSNSLTVHL